jgi:hypothetical protein
LQAVFFRTDFKPTPENTGGATTIANTGILKIERTGAP